MPKRISDITQSLRQIGEIQITDWDFVALLNNDIDLAQSLRKLGNVKVIDWDFKTVMPTVHKIAHKELELPELVLRAAQYKVLDWDFRNPLPNEPNPQSRRSTRPGWKQPGPEDMKSLKDRLTAFLRFAVVNLIDEAELAEIRVQEIGRYVVRFQLLVTQTDVKEIIGRNGATASAIRNLLKNAAATEGVHALLEILSHEEEMAGRLTDKQAG